MKRIITYIFIISIFCNGNCRKNRIDNNGLPAATQEGKNTLGFLLNEQVWKPQGFSGTGNLSVNVDFGFNTGIFNIVGYRTIGSTTEQFTFGISDSLNLITIPCTFKVRPNAVLGISYTKLNCDYFSKDATTTAQGSVTITKLDKPNHIISGTFNAILSKAGCETINITEGRFDMKY